MRGLHTMLLVVAMRVASPSAGAEADFTMPEPNYATAQAVMHVIKAAAERELGLEVATVVTTAVPVIWDAMGRNRGEIDVWPDAWVPNQQGLVDKYVNRRASVRLAARGYTATQGYCVTRALAEAHGIRSVTDLADPEIARLFDHDGDGRGEIWVGAPGWQSANVERVKARDYGFADLFELQSTEEAVATAALARADREGGAWVGYCYAPHQNFVRFDLLRLTEPPNGPDCYSMVQRDEDPAWFERSHVACAYPDASVHIAYAASLIRRQPELAQALERIEIDPGAVSRWAFEIVVRGRPAAEVAREWVDANAATVGGWFGH